MVYIHLVFDIIALISAILIGWVIYLWRFKSALPQTTAKINHGYFIALSFGSITGAYLFGTLNLYLSGIEEFARSILGALIGATLMVEIYKLKRGTKGSTGYIYAIPFAVIIIFGRIGCLLSGLHDHTHGIPTGNNWGWDYGDAILRHPVQLYESLSMVIFFIIAIIILKTKPNFFISYGFYLCTGFYAVQRFLWEFLKPYGTVTIGLNIFQILCLLLIIYSIMMMYKDYNDKPQRT